MLSFAMIPSIHTNGITVSYALRMHFQHTTIQMHFCHKQLSEVDFKFSPNKKEKNTFLFTTYKIQNENSQLWICVGIFVVIFIIIFFFFFFFFFTFCFGYNYKANGMLPNMEFMKIFMTKCTIECKLKMVQGNREMLDSCIIIGLFVRCWRVFGIVCTFSISFVLDNGIAACNGDKCMTRT